MRIVIAMTLALAILGLQGGPVAADNCRYLFKTGEGLVDSCTGEKASNSNPSGIGPAIVTHAPAAYYIGSLDPPADFCDFAPCIATFWDGKGYVVQCVDGKYSKAGGRQGGCSFHGGFA